MDFIEWTDYIWMPIGEHALKHPVIIGIVLVLTILASCTTVWLEYRHNGGATAIVSGCVCALITAEYMIHSTYVFFGELPPRTHTVADPSYVSYSVVLLGVLFLFVYTISMVILHIMQHGGTKLNTYTLESRFRELDYKLTPGKRILRAFLAFIVALSIVTAVFIVVMAL